jgi:hypothetical protein
MTFMTLIASNVSIAFTAMLKIPCALGIEWAFYMDFKHFPPLSRSSGDKGVCA